MKRYLLVLVVFCALFAAQAVIAQTPEEILEEMENLSEYDYTAKEKYEKTLSFYDEPSKKFLKAFMEFSAEMMGISVDELLAAHDQLKEIEQNLNFDFYPKFNVKEGDKCGFSNFQQYRSIDKNDIVEITQTADFDIDKFTDCFLENNKNNPMYSMYFKNGKIDDGMKQVLKVILEKTLSESFFQGGKFINKILFVKSNGTWKIHITKEQADLIFPDDSYNNPSDYLRENQKKKY